MTAYKLKITTPSGHDCSPQKYYTTKKEAIKQAFNHINFVCDEPLVKDIDDGFIHTITTILTNGDKFHDGESDFKYRIIKENI